MTSGTEEPVFAAPWEAKAFAMAVALRDAGVLEWSEFAERLAAEIATGTGSYYEQWVAALEAVLADRGITG